MSPRVTSGSAMWKDSPTPWWIVRLQAALSCHYLTKAKCVARTYRSPVQLDVQDSPGTGRRRAIVYLRPETAQGIFVNFLNILNSTRKKIPFGVAQIGKAFRNEITPGNFTFRTREFEQMEIEYFVQPGTDEKIFEDWVKERYNWYVSLGVNPERLRIREHEKDELAHYAKSCCDISISSPWAGRNWRINRTDFDLQRHSESNGVTLNYFDPDAHPYVIEPSAGRPGHLMSSLTLTARAG